MSATTPSTRGRALSNGNGFGYARALATQLSVAESPAVRIACLAGVTGIRWLRVSLIAGDLRVWENQPPMKAARRRSMTPDRPRTASSGVGCAKGCEHEHVARVAEKEQQEAFAREKDKYERSLRKAALLLAEEREKCKRMQVTVDVVQQELMDTVTELKGERDRSHRLQEQLRDLRFHSDASFQVRRRSVHFSAGGGGGDPDAESRLCERCELTQRVLGAAAESGSVSAEMVTDLVQQRVTLERVLSALLFGAVQTPFSGAFLSDMLASKAVQVPTMEGDGPGCPWPREWVERREAHASSLNAVEWVDGDRTADAAGVEGSVRSGRPAIKHRC